MSALDSLKRVKSKEKILKQVKELIGWLEKSNFTSQEVSTWEVKVKFRIVGQRFDEIRDILDEILQSPLILDIDYLYANKKLNEVSLEDLYEIAEYLEGPKDEATKKKRRKIVMEEFEE